MQGGALLRRSALTISNPHRHPTPPPGVNQRLMEMDVNFIETKGDGEKDFSGVKKGDVVILPAFGASVQVGRGGLKSGWAVIVRAYFVFGVKKGDVVILPAFGASAQVGAGRGMVWVRGSWRGEAGAACRWAIAGATCSAPSRWPL